MSEHPRPTDDLPLEEGHGIEAATVLSYAKAVVVLLLCVATAAGIERTNLNAYAITGALIFVILMVTFALRWQWIFLSTATLLVYTAFTFWVVLGAAGWAGFL